MKSNYKPWLIEPSNFPRSSFVEKMEFLLQFAVLAASSHNTQPWFFLITAEGVEIHPDFSRLLKDSDPMQRQLYLSIGCATENFITAARAYGFICKCDILEKDNRYYYRINVSDLDSNIQSKADYHTIKLILERITNRSEYKITKIPNDILYRISNQAQRLGVKIDIFTSDNELQNIASLVKQAFAEIIKRKQFRQELSLWLRNNLTYQPDGMTLNGMGIPTPISFLVPWLLKNFDISSLMIKDVNKLTDATPHFVILSSSQDLPQYYLETGRVFQKFALLAQEAGLSIHPMAATIEVDDYRNRLRAFIDKEYHPQFIFRLGYHTKLMPRSPRRSFSETIIN